MKKLFEISQEDATPVEVVTVEQGMDVLDVLASDENEMAIVSGVAGIEKDQDLLVQTEEQVVAVESRIEVMEVALAAGEVSPGTALMAVAAAKSTAIAVGLPVETVSVSQESANEDPAMALKISLEEEKAMVKKMIDAARALFVKINKNVRKVIAKVIASLSGLKKKADALEAKADGVKTWKDKAEFSEDVEKALRSRFLGTALVIKAAGGKINEPALIADSGLSYTAGLNLQELTSDSLTAATSGELKTGAAGKKAEDIVKNLLKATEDKDSKIKKIDAGSLTGVIYRCDGKSVKLFTTEVSKDGDKVKFNFSTEAIEIKEDVAKDINFKIVSGKAFIGDVVNKIGNVADDLKGFVDTSFSFVDDMEKAFEAKSKEAEKEEDKNSKVVIESAAIKKLYTKSPSIAFGAVMGMYGMIRNSMYLVSETIKVHEAGDTKKEEK